MKRILFAFLFALLSISVFAQQGMHNGGEMSQPGGESSTNSDGDSSSDSGDDDSNHGMESVTTGGDEYTVYSWIPYVIVFVVALFLCFLCNLTCCMCKEAFCPGNCKYCSCSRKRKNKQGNMQPKQQKRAQYMELQQV